MVAAMRNAATPRTVDDISNYFLRKRRQPSARVPVNIRHPTYRQAAAQKVPVETRSARSIFDFDSARRIALSYASPAGDTLCF
jgi:predicted ATPase